MRSDGTKTEEYKIPAAKNGGYFRRGAADMGTVHGKRKGKLLFSGFASKLSVIARPVHRLVVAIPRLEGKCIDNCPTEWKIP